MTQEQTATPATDDQPEITDAPIVKHDLQALENVKVAGELDLLTAAKAFAASGMFPDVKKQSQAVVKIVAGYELGVKPFAAMRGIHFIQFGGTGVLELSANLRGALIKRSGQYDYRVRHLDEVSCSIEFFERAPGNGPFESVGVSEYSVAQAKKAALIKNGGTWEKYPEDMCFAAALRKGAKRYCPDLFVGELAIDDASAAEAVVTQELAAEIPTSDDVVDGDVIEDTKSDPVPAPAQASTEGGQGAGPAADHAPAPEVAPAGELFGDGTPPPPTEPGEDVPESEAVYVGFLRIEHAPDGPHLPADDTEDRINSARIQELRKLMPKMQLTGGALETVWKARYGFPINDGRHAQADAFEAWMQDEATKLKAAV